MRAVASSVSRAVLACSDASAASFARRSPSAVAARSPSSRSLLHPNVGLFDAELGQLFRHALRGFFRVLNRVPQRRGDVQRGKHLRPRGLDVGLEPLDATVLVGVFLFDALQLGGRMLLVLLRAAPPLRCRSTSRRRPGSRRASSAASSARTSSARAPSASICWRLNSICCWRRVMSSSQRVNGLARALVARPFGLDQREADAAEIRFGRADRRGRGRTRGCARRPSRARSDSILCADS